MPKPNLISPRGCFVLLIALWLGSVIGCSNQPNVKVNPKDGKVMVQVSAGNFQMGSNADQEALVAETFSIQLNLPAAETTAQPVSLPEFYIDQTPVTNAEYKKFIDAFADHSVPYLDNPIARSFNWDPSARTFPAGRDKYPAVLVTWHDAAAYCAWAGERLPSEAEWEKAARGTDGRIWPWGNDWDAKKANTAEQNLNDATPVGQFPKGASPYGALDMVGNVWQWTSSLDKAYPYNASDGREDPNAPGMRITRGGAWLFGAAIARTTIRNRFEPDNASLSIGFRCAQ